MSQHADTIRQSADAFNAFMRGELSSEGFAEGFDPQIEMLWRDRQTYPDFPQHLRGLAEVIAFSEQYRDGWIGLVQELLEVIEVPDGRVVGSRSPEWSRPTKRRPNRHPLLRADLVPRWKGAKDRVFPSPRRCASSSRTGRAGHVRQRRPRALNLRGMGTRVYSSSDWAHLRLTARAGLAPRF